MKKDEKKFLRALAAACRLCTAAAKGFGGFVGNVVMGVVFALVWRRTRRVAPLVVAHALIDIVAFIGYAVLKGHVGWL